MGSNPGRPMSEGWFIFHLASLHLEVARRVHKSGRKTATFLLYKVGHLRGLGNALDHRSLPPEFESRRGHI